MKRLLTLLAAAVLMFTGTMVSHAGSRITAILTITNAPETGDTLTSGSSIRTWTNTTTASTITTNSAESWTNWNNSATNLFSHLAATYLPGPLIVQYSTTNALKLIGQLDQSFSLIVTGDWATVTYTTQSFPKSWPVLWPIDAVPAQINRTNQASDIIYGSQYSTNAFTATHAVVSNLVGLGNDQVIGGMKSWSGTNRFYGPVYLTNGTFDNITVTNGFQPLGSGEWSVAMGSGAVASGTESIAIGTSCEATNTGSISIGNVTFAYGYQGLALGSDAQANSGHAMAIGISSTATASNAITIGYGSAAAYADSIAIGTLVSTSTSNQVVLGASTHQVSIPGSLAAPTVTNALLRGTNRIEAYGLQAQGIATLADGANSISLLNTNSSLIRFTGTLTANSSLNGVAGGWPGRMATCANESGYTLTLANQSGLEVTPGNRIVTGTGADVSVPNGSYWTMIYDGTASRWDVVSVWPGAAIGLAAMVMHDITNRYVLVADTWLTITNWSHSNAATNCTVSTAAGTITVGQSGWYSISGGVSVVGVDAGGDNYEIGLFSGTGTTSLDAEAYGHATSTDRHNITSTTFAYLTNTEVIALRINSEVGDDVDILGAQLNVNLIRP